MFGRSQVTCALCSVQTSRKDALRAYDRKEVAVCRNCHEQWDRAGKTCAACQTPVKGSQEIGVFLDRHAFGHADCGAIRLTR